MRLPWTLNFARAWTAARATLLLSAALAIAAVGCESSRSRIAGRQQPSIDSTQ